MRRKFLVDRGAADVGHARGQFPVRDGGQHDQGSVALGLDARDNDAPEVCSILMQASGLQVWAAETARPGRWYGADEGFVFPSE